MTFGGSSWPINSTDMNLGQISQGSTQCVGAIFDLGVNGPGDANPTWVIGDTFLVSQSSMKYTPLLMMPELQKNVYSVFRDSTPPSIGFALLSAAALGLVSRLFLVSNLAYLTI
jgi:cathepsin D